MRKKHAVKLIIITAVAFSIVLKLLWSLPYQSQQLWRGYQVALVEEASGINIEQLKADLKRTGFPRIISYSDQKVTLFRYFGDSRIHTVGLESVPQLLEPQDPRFDPYLRNLPNYFQGRLDGRKAEVLYLELPEDAGGTLMRARKILTDSGAAFYLSGCDPLSRLVLWALAGLTLLTIAALFPKKFKVRASLLVWLVGALLTFLGVPHFAMSSFTWWLTHIVGWTLLMGWAGPAMKRYLNTESEKEFFLRSLKRYLFLYTGAVLIGVAAGQLGSDSQVWPRLAVQSLLTMGIHAGLLYAFYSFHTYLSRRQLHSLFVPVSISAQRQLSGHAIRLRLAVFVCVAGIFPLVLLPVAGANSSVEAEFPLPEMLTGENNNSAENSTVDSGTTDSGPAARDGGVPISWERLYRAAQRQNSTAGPSGRQLPDLTDYVRHRAFQEGYFYGRPYVFPAPGEEITIPVYRQEGIEVFTRDKVVKMFTDEWYKDIIGFAYNNGVPRLLLEQGKPVQVHVGTLEPFRISKYAIFGHIGVMLILVPVVFFIVSRKVISQNFLIEKHQLKKGQKVA